MTTTTATAGSHPWWSWPPPPLSPPPSLPPPPRSTRCAPKPLYRCTAGAHTLLRKQHHQRRKMKREAPQPRGGPPLDTTTGAFPHRQNDRHRCRRCPTPQKFSLYFPPEHCRQRHQHCRLPSTESSVMPRSIPLRTASDAAALRHRPPRLNAPSSIPAAVHLHATGTAAATVTPSPTAGVPHAADHHRHKRHWPWTPWSPTLRQEAAQRNTAPTYHPQRAGKQRNRTDLQTRKRRGGGGAIEARGW